MKKILSISVIAMMAVAPAFATRDAAVAVANFTAGGSETALATTSYVQGAYEEASDRIDALVTDTAVAAKANNGTYAAIVAGDSVSENLVHLDDKIGTTTFEGASVSAAINALQTSAGNLGTGKVDQEGNFTDNADSTLIKNKTVVNAIKDTAAQVDTNTGAISTLNGSDSTAGSVAKSIKDKVETLDATQSQTAGTDGLALSITEADGVITGISGSIAANTYQAYSDSTVASGTNYLTAGNGVGSNLTALDTAVGKVAELEQGQSYNTGIAHNKSVAENLEALDTAIGNLNTTAGNTYQTLSDSAVDTAAAGTYTAITAGNEVGNNLEALDSHVKTIENKQIPIVSSWSTNTVTYTEIKNLTSGN